MEIITGTNLRIKDIVAQTGEKGLKVILVDSEASIEKAKAILTQRDKVAVVLISNLHHDDAALVKKPQSTSGVSIIDMLLRSSRKLETELSEVRLSMQNENEFPNKSIKKPLPKPTPFKGFANKFKNHNFKRR